MKLAKLCKLYISLILFIVISLLPASANHQMSFSTDKTYYIAGRENITLTLKDNDNDGAFVPWGGIAVYDANTNEEVANYNDNQHGQGNIVNPAGQKVWIWGQKYDVCGTCYNSDKNGQQVPLGTYYGLAETGTLEDYSNRINYRTSNFVIDTDNNNNGVPDSLDDTDGDGVSDPQDSCPITYGTSTLDRKGCPDSDKDGVSDVNDVCSPPNPIWREDVNGFQDTDGCADESIRIATEKKAKIAEWYVNVAGLAAIIGTGAAAIVPVSLLLTGFGETAFTVAVAAGAYFAKDPPDLENFDKPFILVDRNFEPLVLTDDLRASEQDLSISIVKASDVLTALTKSMEKYSGAEIKHNKQAMKLQAKQIVKYAELSKTRFAEVKNKIDSHIRLSRNLNVNVVLTRSDITSLKENVSVNGVPREEIDFARNVLKFNEDEVENLQRFVLTFDVNTMPETVDAVSALHNVSIEIEKLNLLLKDFASGYKPIARASSSFFNIMCALIAAAIAVFIIIHFTKKGRKR